MDVIERELKLPEERAILVSWLTSEPWIFHGTTNLDVERVNSLIDAGTFGAPDAQTFWLFTSDAERVGLIRIFDLQDIVDGNPLFDLRIKRAYRGKGFGKAALRWMTTYLFEKYPALNRIEGNTRFDNIAMRRVFRDCGYVKEGHYRDGWHGDNGQEFDSVLSGRTDR